MHDTQDRRIVANVNQPLALQDVLETQRAIAANLLSALVAELTTIK